MDAFLKRATHAAAPLTIFAVTLAGCGGHSSGGTSPPRPGVPVISNLTATFGDGNCALQNRVGRPLTLTVQYSDSDGDIKGGTLETTGNFHPSEQSIDANFTLPSPVAIVTGTTDGSITAFACIILGGNSSVTISAALLDKAGNSSNILATQVNLEAPRTLGNQGSADARFGMLRQ